MPKGLERLAFIVIVPARRALYHRPPARFTERCPVIPTSAIL
jgi:hypothetical protein